VLRAIVPATLIAIALLSVPSYAQRCEGGDLVLEDQRDLAAFADALEVACPCAAAVSRSAYRRCAKGVRDTALGAGNLRSACRKKATRYYKRSTCGSDKIACGQFRASSAAKPLRCRVTRADKCTDQPKVDASLCPGETHCEAVVEETATTCVHPTRSGPFTTGSRVFNWEKTSVVSPPDPRPLDTMVWYPAAGTGSPPAVDPAGAPYPIVLFSHGSCGFPGQSTFLTPLIASYGYIVVAPPHPGNTLFDFPDCSSAGALVASAVERPNDMVFVLDQILAENADPASDFFAMADPSRVVMSGHSFGGLTTYLTQAIEPRVTHAMAFAPATGPTSALTVPSLTMLGQLDSVASNPGVRAAFAA